ncbi:MAG: DUF59 domain-containing protein [Magnetococcales bacterium]|nr:DUF59 domain-containing protein [Magnetococcales bacterium]
MIDIPKVEAAVWRALATIVDPEMNIDIVALGLIYEVKVHPLAA